MVGLPVENGSESIASIDNEGGQRGRQKSTAL